MSYPNLLDRGNVNGNAYGHTYRELYIGGGAKAHLGDNKFHFGPFNAPTTFSFPSDRPETPPRPSAAIPFSRDKDFVKRSIILNQIHEQCAMPGSRTALVGLGGVGKSQLAIEFAYRTRERSSETWVFWVHAGNASRFEQGYREIADRVKISGRQNPEANIFKLVYDWLCDSKGQWLLILDNVDDACFLLDAPVYDQRQPTDSATASKPLREYLPHCQSGSILITTRNKDAALKLVEGGDIISVGPMDEEDALALFEKKLGVHHVSSGIAELAAALEHLPLAIVQAAAYISKRAPRCSVVDYLAKFKESDYKRTSLLNRNEGHLRRDWEAKNSIIITWKISFDYIHKTRPSAANLLSLMSFFDGQGIPENLLRNRTEHGKAQGNHKGQEDNELISHEEDTLSQSSAGDDEFEDNVLALRNFSFISVNVDGKTFRMHALVQVAMRKWLEEYGELDRWKQQFVKNLYAEFPTGEYENWAVCQTLFTHAKSAAAQKPEESTLAEWATLLYRAAEYSWGKGSVVDAKLFSVKSFEARRKALGQEHEDTLSSMEMLALAHNLRGQWEDAEKQFLQVMEIRKKKLGVDHPSTLTSMNNLASTYWNQGRWDAAEELGVQVMEMSKKKLGADHPDTLAGMAILASTYWNQGRWDTAEELEVQVMEMSKKKLGADHPSTLTSMNNLASTYWNQGRWDAAEELGVQVIEMSKKKLGADHPDTLASMAILASTYMNQGRWDAAEELGVQVLEIRKKKLGADHPSTLTSMNNLALTYTNQGRWNAAEELGVQVMEIRKQKLGADHPSTLTSMAILASTYWNQGRWDAAEELEVQVIEIRKKNLGADHPSTLTSMNNLAFTRKGQGRDVEAISLMKECVRLQRHTRGVNNSSFVAYSNVLAKWEKVQVDDCPHSG